MTGAFQPLEVTAVEKCALVFGAPPRMQPFHQHLVGLRRLGLMPPRSHQTHLPLGIRPAQYTGMLVPADHDLSSGSAALAIPEHATAVAMRKTQTLRPP